MANRFLVAGGTGNWNSTTNWSATTGGSSGASFPVAGDVVALDSNSGNANLVVNVASAAASLVMSGTYAGTLTFDSTLTLTSTVTFVSACTIAGTAGTLILNGGATITSGGKTLTCGLTFGAAATYTLAANWTVNGLVNVTGAAFSTTTINGFQITCAGGFRMGGGTNLSTGTTKLVITGGTWDATSTGSLTQSIDLAGNVTVSGTVVWAGSGGTTLTYVSGTITTTGSTLTTNSSVTFNTAGMTWNNLTLGATTALTSNLAWSGTLTLPASPTTFSGAGTLAGPGGLTPSASTVTVTLNNTGGLATTGTLTLPNAAITFAGSAGYSVGTQTNTTYTASRIVTLTFGNTYAVTTALGNVGTTSAIRQALKSSSAGNKVVFTVTAGAALTLSYCDPTDIDSNAGGQVFTFGGTITTTNNWTSTVTAGGIGTPGGGSIFQSSIIQGDAA